MSRSLSDDELMSTLCDALASSTRDEGRLRSVLNGIADWEPFIRLAARQGVDGVIHHHACRIGVRIPDEVGTMLARWEFVRSMRFKETLESTVAILVALEAAGIAAVPLKGPVLASRYYGVPAVRPSFDIDILIDGTDLDLAIEVLRPLGLVCSDAPDRIAAHRRRDYHVKFESESVNVVVEMHFHAYRASGGLIDASHLLERSQPWRVDNGRSIRVLAPSDELLYLAAHAAKHFDISLKLLYDLKLLVESHPDDTWQDVRSEAARTGTIRALASVLRDLDDFLEVRVPSLNELRGRARRASFVAMLRRTLSDEKAPRQARVLAAIAAGAVLADSTPRMVGTIGRGSVRAARRWASHQLPRFVPRNWDV